MSPFQHIVRHDVGSFLSAYVRIAIRPNDRDEWDVLSVSIYSTAETATAGLFRGCLADGIEFDELSKEGQRWLICELNSWQLECEEMADEVAS